ncbi:MAG: hydrogenase small subunit [Thermodesulfobacteriota bacterium]
MEKQELVFSRLDEKGVSRRDFMKFCSVMAAAMGLAPAMIPRIAEAVTAKARPPVIWLHFAECTGCSEGFLRASYPFADEIVLEVLDVAYHETIMAAAGDLAEQNLHNAVKTHKGKYICVIEGAIPTKNEGRYGLIGGRTMLEIGREVTKDALATICIGTCSSFGGVQAAKPNPTEAKGVGEALGLKTINISGCPPNPVNFVATIVHFLLLGKLPDLDKNGRPLFAYGQTIHDNCPRRAHFEEGRFVKVFGDEGTAQGWCLYEVGCKGPETYNNCPKLKFNQGASWPVEAGHPCIGCSEPNFWDASAPFFVAK